MKLVRAARVTALMVAVGFQVVIYGCGGSSFDGNAASGLLRPTTAVLRRACAATAAKTGLRILCPARMPVGRLDVDYVGQGLPADSYEISMHSPGDGGSAGGHWVLLGGPTSALRKSLDNVAARAQLVERVIFDERPLIVLRVPSSDALNAGHVVVLWHVGARAYAVSMHGYQEEAIAMDIARSAL